VLGKKRTSDALRIAKHAIGAAGRLALEALATGKSAARAAVQSATRASEVVGTAAGTTGRAVAEASAITHRAFGAVGHATARGSAPASNSSLETGEILLPRIASHNNFALRGLLFFVGIWFAALAVILLIWLHNAYQADDVIGTAEAAVLVATLFAAGSWLYREGRAWRRLAVAQEIQRWLSDESRTASDEARFRATMRRLRKTIRETTLVEFIEGADRGADAATLREQLDLVGLCGVDANAIEAIRQTTRDVFFLSLLSTNALIETAAFSIRALGMIRRIAGAYGHRPGRIGTIRLARHILADIALLPIGMMLALEAGRGAGSAVHRLGQSATRLGTAVMRIPEPHHMAVGVAVSGLGLAAETAGTIAENITPRVADAALAAGRMGHLGLLTIAHVRPVPLSRSRYATMRSKVLRTILRLRKDAARQRKELRA
jgi:hypothetical protein